MIINIIKYSQEIESMYRYASPINPVVYPHLSISLLAVGIFFFLWFFVLVFILFIKIYIYIFSI